MKAQIHSLSLRARQFLENPKFLGGNPNDDFTVSLDGSDKILTVLHHHDPQKIEFLFGEILSFFAGNKTIPELWGLNFREAESFLRDENHRPAFSQDLPEMEEAFLQTKISLIASAVRSKLGPELLGPLKEKDHWENLNLAAQNLLAQNILKPLDWELILFEEGTLIITKVPFGLPEGSLDTLFQSILRGGEKVLPMKVVAV